MDTPTICAALRERLQHPEWALFFEVSCGTGSHGGSYADAVAMNLYPSRGLEVHGFEVKASRSDWVRELKNPLKAEPVFRYCDRWWLVVGDKEFVKPGELPATWGLMVPKGKGLTIGTPAPKLAPVALDRPFFAALTRRASAPGQEEIDAIVRKRVNDEVDREKKWAEQRANSTQETLNKLREKVTAFENAAGIHIGNFRHTPQQIGEAVRFVLDGGMKGLDGELAAMERNAERLLKEIKAVRPVAS